MDVLTSPPPSTSPFAATTTPVPLPPSPPAAAPSPKPTRSLLDRRQTTGKLQQQPTSSLPPHGSHPESSTLSGAMHSSPNSSSSSVSTLRMSISSHVGVPTMSRSATTATTLAFVPLTPIMASPRLTPEIGTAAGSVMATAEGRGRADYLNRGRAGTSSASGAYALYAAAAGSGRVCVPLGADANTSLTTTASTAMQATNVSLGESQREGGTMTCISSDAVPTPSWTSTPPTPPLHGVPVPISANADASSRRDPTGLPEASSSAQSRSNSDSSQSRSRRAAGGNRAISRHTSLPTLLAYQPLPLLSLSPACRDGQEAAADGVASSIPGSLLRPAEEVDDTKTAHVAASGAPRASVESASRSYPDRTGAHMDAPFVLSPSLSSKSPSPAVLPSTRAVSSSWSTLPGALPGLATRAATATTTTTLDSLDNTNATLHFAPETTVKRRRTLPRLHTLSPPSSAGCDQHCACPTDPRRLPHRPCEPEPQLCESPSELSPEPDMRVLELESGCLGPSLSRKSRAPRCVRSKGSFSGRETSAGSGRGRRMFIVGDADGSDVDVDNDNDNECEGCVDEQERKEVVEEREVRWTGRRYHALLELVTTEVGYLTDLRALVSIHLAQLPSLDAPIPTTLSRPSPSSLSISSLSLTRPFPSSRSFLHLPPAATPGPGPPASDSASPTSAGTERHRDAFDRERVREGVGGSLAASTSTTTAGPLMQKDSTNTNANQHLTVNSANPTASSSGGSKPSRRRLFTEHDVQTIARNAAALLALHETFVKRLKYALEPLGFGDVFAPGGKGKNGQGERAEVERAVEAVSELFCEQASSFEAYEAFCPGHNEAADLVRAVQEHHPVEWDAFEQRCSLRVAHAFDRQGGSPSMDSLRGSMKSKRRHSLSSLAMPVSLSPFGAVSPAPVLLGHAKSDPLASGHKRKGSEDVPSSSVHASASASAQAGRLKFLDYLIKPVQRICKYPLLLDQLKLKRATTGGDQDDGGGMCGERETDPAEAAASAMRRVAALVDRASERRAHTIKSSRIASRLLADCPASPTSPVSASAERPQTQQLSAEFMQSLGACLLAGALDVVYYQANGSARAKYLAAFLYVGGYVVLAKVPRGGKTYEPKHWFGLGGFEIVDQEDDETLPYAFHLCSPTAQIHLAAACQLEKTIWMTAIQDSLAVGPSSWVNEPAANPPTGPLLFAAAPEEAVSPEWSATPLPTIQSMSELETTPAEAASPNAPTPPMPSPRKIAKTMSRADSLIMRQELSMTTLSRRTSTTSVKAFFAPLTFDARVTRPSSQIRQQVDHGLHDVFSDTVVAVRSQAVMRDEELFQLRKRLGNVSRSNSALSISGAFGTRRRHDSTILGARRKSSMDVPVDVAGEAEAAGKTGSSMLARRSKSSSGKLKRQRLSLLPASAPPLPAKSDQDDNMPVVERSQSPSPLTRGPSAASSNTNSVLPSPVEMTMPLPTPPGTMFSRTADRPKRTRSMVDNVKHFFQSRSTSPTPLYQQSSSPRVSVVHLDVEPETHGGLVQWWRRGSLRRRAQSSPDALTDESAPVTPAASSDDSSHAELKDISDRDLLSASTTMLSAGAPSRQVSFSQSHHTPLTRRRSLFATSPRLDAQAAMTTQSMTTLSRSKTLKTIFSFQRSPSAYDDAQRLTRPS